MRVFGGCELTSSMFAIGWGREGYQRNYVLFRVLLGRFVARKAFFASFFDFANQFLSRRAPFGEPVVQVRGY